LKTEDRCRKLLSAGGSSAKNGYEWDTNQRWARSRIRSRADPESGYIFRSRIRVWIFGKKPDPDSVWMVWCI